MARRIGVFWLWLFLAASTASAGDDLSDFTNNLAQDLGPLLALFGEAITKQYLSESTTFLDYFIFALGPLGVLTAITSVVRLCGHTSLLALIGRSQESAATVESELCTSTSRDVCELFNQRGIARVIGRPTMLDLVLVTPQKGSETVRQGDAKLMLSTKYFNSPEISSLHWQFKRNSIFTKSNSDVANVEFAPEPNLSLNVGIKKVPTWASGIVALFGLVCQVGVLTLAGYGAWKLDWNLHPDLGSPSSRDYAPRMFLAGTFLLSLGMWSCAAIIGQATQEIRFGRVKGADGSGSQLIWLQPGQQLIGDQSFDSYLYMENKDKPLDHWVSSKNRDELKYKRLFELLTFGAVLMTTVGYILQFIGLRGLKAWVSLAQLGITLTMSILRGSLRIRRLQKADNELLQVLDLVSGNELDSLALILATGTVGYRSLYDVVCWAAPDSDLQGDIHQPTDSFKAFRTREHGYWYISGACVSIVESAANSEEETINNTPSRPRQSRPDCEYADKDTHAYLTYGGYNGKHPHAQAFDFRAQLAVLTGNLGGQNLPLNASACHLWTSDLVNVRQTAVRLSLAIGQIADDLFGFEITTSTKLVMRSVIPVNTDTRELSGGTNSTAIDISVDLIAPSPKDRTWTCNAAQVEAALGLWHWNLVYFCRYAKANAAQDMPSFHIVSAGRADTAWKEKTDIDALLELWLDKRDFNSKILHVVDIDSITPHQAEGSEMGDIQANLLRTTPFERITGWNIVYQSLCLDTRQPLSDTVLPQAAAAQQGQDACRIRMQCILLRRSLVQCCAHQLFVALATALVSHDRFKFPETTVVEADGQRRLENVVVSALQSALVDNRIATAAEGIFLCLPAFRDKLYPSSDTLFCSILENSKTHRLNGERQRAEVLLRWGCDVFHQNSLRTDTDASKFEYILRATGELYRKSYAVDALDSFVESGIQQLINTYKIVDSHEGKDILNCYGKILEMFQENRTKLAPETLATHLVEDIRRGDRASTLYHLCYLKTGDFGLATLQPALPLAVRNNWNEVVDDMLEKKANADSRDESGRTGISHCAEMGNTSLLDTLVKAGAFLDQPDSNLFSPLHWSAVAGTEDAANMILSSGKVDLERPNNKAMTALCCAVDNNRPTVVAMLLEHGANAGFIQGTMEEPVLFLAVKRGYLTCAAQLLRLGANVNQPGWRGRTALHVASETANADMANLLLANAADPNLEDEEKESALGVAAGVGSATICADLIAHGANVKGTNQYGYTALQKAAMYGHAMTVRQLLELGADIHEKNRSGRTPLHLAAACYPNDSLHAIEVLLENGASINETDESETSPLYMAVEALNNDAIKPMLRLGAKINQAIDDGSTPLHRAASRDNWKGMQILLENGASVNLANKKGRTALMVAANSANFDCVKILLEAGADPNVKDASGKTAALLAVDNGDYRIQSLIISEMKQI